MAVKTKNFILEKMDALKPSILPYLKTDFEKNLWEAAIKNLEDGKNKLRLNNFACAARELARPSTLIARMQWQSSMASG